MKNNQKISNVMRSAAWQAMVDSGAAGTSNRARTMQSKREKQNDPRRQRKTWRADME